MPAYKQFAHGKSKPGHENELRLLIQELVFSTQQEMSEFGDIELYNAYETQTPGEFLFHEEFTTQAAFERHMKTAHLQKILPQLAEHPDGAYTYGPSTP